LNLTPKSVHLCLLHVDEHHCGNPFSWLTQTRQPVILSRNEQHEVIKKYAHLDREIVLEESCRIGVGYTTCQDIGFRAVDLFTALEPELRNLTKITPQVHSQINNFAQFVETFLWHFKEGANGEYVSQSDDLFRLLLNRLSSANITLV